MKKILLVCLDNLGDLVFVSALARALSQDPEVELSLWCKDYTARLAHLMPGVKKIYAADPFWDRVPKQKRGSVRKFLRSWRSVRRGHFDLAVMTSQCWRTAIAVQLAQIPVRWGPLGRRNRPFLTNVVPWPDRTELAVRGFLRVFHPLVPREGIPPFTWLDRRRLPQLELPKPLQAKKFAVLHAFAGRADRCAPLEVWEVLAKEIEAAGYSILWTGTKNELSVLRQRWPQLEAEHFVDTWAADLEKLAFIWSEASLFVGHDSGPLHVAHALGVPVVGLYLPGQKRTFPQAEAPSYCYHVSSPAAIKLEELLAGLRDFLRRD